MVVGERRINTKDQRHIWGNQQKLKHFPFDTLWEMVTQQANIKLPVKIGGSLKSQLKFQIGLAGMSSSITACFIPFNYNEHEKGYYCGHL